MGVYLYTIRKLKKSPLHFKREDGSIFKVSHELVCRMSNITSEREQREVAMVIGQQESNYRVYSGTVLKGDTLIQWRGNAYWFDCDKYPGEVVGEDVKLEWEGAKQGVCRLPTAKVTAPSGNPMHLSRWVQAKRAPGYDPNITPTPQLITLFAVRLAATNQFEFRGGHWGPHRVDAADEARVLIHWKGYCDATQLWAQEDWDMHQPSPGPWPLQEVMTPAPYDHAACLEAAFGVL